MDEAALAARRRELEEAHEAKLRDLKAQQKRVLDGLERDRADWEARRRDQARELADRAEKVRRAEENQRRDAELLRAARAELERLKQEAAAREAERVEAKAKQAALASKVEVLKVSRARAGPLVGLAVAGFLACLLSALLWPAATTAAIAAVFLALALAAGLLRR